MKNDQIECVESLCHSQFWRTVHDKETCVHDLWKQRGEGVTMPETGGSNFSVPNQKFALRKADGIVTWCAHAFRLRSYWNTQLDGQGDVSVCVTVGG